MVTLVEHRGRYCAGGYGLLQLRCGDARHAAVAEHAGCHGRPGELPHKLLHQCCAQAAHDIVGEVAVASHHWLENAAKHPQRKHVEENVGKSRAQAARVVHEHVGHKLPQPEVAAFPEVQPQVQVQVHPLALEHEGGHPHEHIDDEQVFGYRRNRVDEPSVVVIRCHVSFSFLFILFCCRSVLSMFLSANVMKIALLLLLIIPKTPIFR